jgi:hypothetical protein
VEVLDLPPEPEDPVLELPPDEALVLEPDSPQPKTQEKHNRSHVHARMEWSLFEFALQSKYARRIHNHPACVLIRAFSVASPFVEVAFAAITSSAQYRKDIVERVLVRSIDDILDT